MAELETQWAGEMAGDDGVADALKAVESMAGQQPNEELGAPEAVETPDLEAAQRKKELMGQAIGKGIPTETEVPPANADADDRIEELPEQDEENIKEVAKQLQLLLAKRGVGKSVDPTGAEPIVLVAKAMQAMGDRMAVQESAMQNLLKGMGIADRVAEEVKVEKEAERMPVASIDQAQVASMVVKALAGVIQGGSVEGAKPDDQKSLAEVRKDMSGVMATLGQNSLWAVPVQQPAG